MTSVWGILRLLWQGPDARLTRLKNNEMVIDIKQVSEKDEVIQIGLGFGAEYWLVTEGWSINPQQGCIDGGKLLLKDGRPLKESELLPVLQRPVKKIMYRY